MFKEPAARAVPQRAGSEETRRQILDTALALFRERGFEETTIRDIAGRAGLSLGAAYYYFKSKEAIVGAYYDYVQHEHLARAREAFAARRQPSRPAARRPAHQDRHHAERSAAAARAVPLRRRTRTSLVVVRSRHARATSAVASTCSPRRSPGSAGPTMCARRRRRCCGRSTWASCCIFLYDESPNQRRTRKLIDASVDFVVDVKRLVTSPLLRPMRRRVMTILRDAGLLAAHGDAAKA